jgi:hypothetical protein
MTQATNGPATSPAGPSGRPGQAADCQWCGRNHYTSDCPYLYQRDGVGRALELMRLHRELAELRATATRIYATAYLEADGNAEARTQAAKLATAKAHLLAEYAAAKVNAYQRLLEDVPADED